MPVSLDYKNPGALNTVAWVRQMPGFVGEKETTKGNVTARFDSYENGVAAWFELMRRYNAKGATTVGAIITTYGGTGQDYSEYLNFVVARTGFQRSQVIDLNNDRHLLTLGKAMFAYEAGAAAWARAAIRDGVLVDGFNRGRKHAGMKPTGTSWVSLLITAVLSLLKRK